MEWINELNLVKRNLERAIIRYSRTNSGFYFGNVKRQARRYILAAIEENEGIYKELLELDTIQLIGIVCEYDEIRAYIATHLIFEDMPDDYELLIELQSAISRWCIKGSLFNYFPTSNTWSDWYIKLGFKIQDMLSNWYCRECEQQFYNQDDFDNHYITIPASQYPHAYGWDAPEIICDRDDEIPF